MGDRKRGGGTDSSEYGPRWVEAAIIVLWTINAALFYLLVCLILRT